MKKLDPTMAQQVAQAISVYQEQRTGYPPKAVTVVLSDDTLVVTLHEALSPAEKALSHTPEGAAQVQEFHRQLFHDSVDTLREEIRRITGHRGGRSCRGSGDDNRRRRARLHDRHDGTGVPARRQNLRRRLEWRWTRGFVAEIGGSTMLVVSTKTRHGFRQQPPWADRAEAMARRSSPTEPTLFLRRLDHVTAGW